jgi:hypothetical protein
MRTGWTSREPTGFGCPTSCLRIVIERQTDEPGHRVIDTASVAERWKSGYVLSNTPGTRRSETLRDLTRGRVYDQADTPDGR